MSFILDTCAVSELRKERPEKEFLSWFEKVRENDLFLSCLTVGELEYGISLLSDGVKKREIMNWLEQVKTVFAPRILPVTTAVVIRWGAMRADLRRRGIRLPTIDGLLAATAIESDHVLITRNVGDFSATGARIHSPWP